MNGVNIKSQKEVEKTILSLDNAQDSQVKDNPERKTLIDELRKTWGVTVKKRCDLEASESKGTDAEISEINTCLVKGCKEELEYFNNMPP